MYGAHKFARLLGLARRPARRALTPVLLGSTWRSGEVTFHLHIDTPRGITCGNYIFSRDTQADVVHAVQFFGGPTPSSGIARDGMYACARECA